MALLTVLLLATSALRPRSRAARLESGDRSILAKIATALILLDWHRGSLARVAVVALVAWSGVHSYTGAVFVAAGVFAAVLAPALAGRQWAEALRRGAVVAAVVALLQAPWAVYRLTADGAAPVMGVVTGSLMEVVHRRRVSTTRR